MKRENDLLKSANTKTIGNSFTLNNMIPHFKTVHLTGLQYDTQEAHGSNNLVGKKIDKLDIYGDFSTGSILHSLKIVINNMEV